MIRTGCLILATLLLAATSARAVDVDFETIPRSLQLFARDTNDSASVVVAGVIRSTGHESIRLDLFRNGVLSETQSSNLIYNEDECASFALQVQLLAELAEYRIRVSVDGTEIAQRDSLLCGDVYLINGQSNAKARDRQGDAQNQSEWLRSFGTSSLSGTVVSADTLWTLAQASTVLDHGAIGVWGLRFGEILIQQHKIPVAILNGAQGGTAIAQFLRNDSEPEDLETLYGRLLWRTARAGVQGSVKGILWHQGEADTGGGWVHYLNRFTTLWNAWIDDYSDLKKVYVFQIHHGCGADRQSEIREIQRVLPEQFPDLHVLSTVGLDGHDGCHYNFQGYNQMGSWISQMVSRDFHGVVDNLQIPPPNILGAYYTTSAQDEIGVYFSTDIVWPADSLGASMSDYFALDDDWNRVESGEVSADGKTIFLHLTGPASATTLTYLPNLYYHGTSVIYQGPWLRNPEGVGALSFHNFPIDEPATVPGGAMAVVDPILTCSPNPFQSSTLIRFVLESSDRLRLQVFDPRGRLIRVLADRVFEAGAHEFIWDGVNESGQRTPSGVYFIRMTGKEGALSSAPARLLR